MVERAVLMARGRVLMPEPFASTVNGNAGHDRKQVEIDLFSLPFHKAVSELERRLIDWRLQICYLPLPPGLFRSSKQSTLAVQENRRTQDQRLAVFVGPAPNGPLRVPGARVRL
jgi:hypothetical protein